MRRIAPAFLTGIVAASLTIPASASVPSRPYTTTARTITSQFDSQAFSLDEFRHQLMSPTLDPHPFSNEFYLHEFAMETPTESHREHSRLSNAASGLSKKVASWRRALARMMP